MTIPAIAVAIYCTVTVAVALLVSDLPKPSWMIGFDRHEHPFGYWAVVGLLAAIGAAAWLRVAGLV